MTYDLYWVSVLGYIVITLIILIRERKYTHHTGLKKLAMTNTTSESSRAAETN